MNSENQDGKTEPASQATVWDFDLGNYAWIQHFTHYLSPHNISEEAAAQ